MSAADKPGRLERWGDNAVLWLFSVLIGFAVTLLRKRKRPPVAGLTN